MKREKKGNEVRMEGDGNQRRRRRKRGERGTEFGGDRGLRGRRIHGAHEVRG